jgi:hypothetical protein
MAVLEPVECNGERFGQAEARFPCRLFALLDWARWSDEYGYFKIARRALVLHRGDLELKFLHPQTVMDTYHYVDAAMPAAWGDLHVPLSTFKANLPGLGRYDTVVFGQTR